MARVALSPSAPATGTRSDGSAETVAAVGVLAIGVAAVYPSSRVDHGPVLCPFRRLTGLPCPGCGMTRSWVHLMHGQWADAFHANPFGVVAMAAVVALAVAVVVCRLRGRPAPALNDLARTRPAQAVIAAWLVFSAVRLVLAI